MFAVKSLLSLAGVLCIALVAFSLGQHYGEVNTRAHALASEISLPLQLHVQLGPVLDEPSRERVAEMLDRRIVAGVRLRERWYLEREAREKLDRAIGHALAVRGSLLVDRYGDDAQAELRNAIVRARDDLNR